MRCVSYLLLGASCSGTQIEFVVFRDWQLWLSAGIRAVVAGEGNHAIEERVAIKWQAPLKLRLDGAWISINTSTLRAQGPTTLVSLLLIPMTTHATLPVISGAHAGEPTPVPPTTFVHPDQNEPLYTVA